MVRLFAPALSLGASGTIGEALTFATWKGRAYLRERVIPSNPKSQAQWGIRSMLRFLSQEWSGLSAADKATWETLAESQAISPFNAYVQQNMYRWRDFLTPSADYPAAGGGTPAAITATTTLPVGKLIVSQVTLGAGADQWGVIVYVDPVTGFTPSRGNARYIAAAAASGITALSFGPFDPGTYYLRFHSFDDTGAKDTSYATEDSVTIT